MNPLIFGESTTIRGIVRNFKIGHVRRWRQFRRFSCLQQWNSIKLPNVLIFRRVRLGRLGNYIRCQIRPHAEKEAILNFCLTTFFNLLTVFEMFFKFSKKKIWKIYMLFLTRGWNFKNSGRKSASGLNFYTALMIIFWYYYCK